MLSSAQFVIIIITPLSFIPAMNIYETALLDGPNWKSNSVAGAERTRERQGENELKGVGGRIAVLYFLASLLCLLFFMQQ